MYDAGETFVYPHIGRSAWSHKPFNRKSHNLKQIFSPLFPILPASLSCMRLVEPHSMSPKFPTNSAPPNPLLHVILKSCVSAGWFLHHAMGRPSLTTWPIKG